MYIEQNGLETTKNVASNFSMVAITKGRIHGTQAGKLRPFVPINYMKEVVERSQRAERSWWKWEHLTPTK